MRAIGMGGAALSSVQNVVSNPDHTFIARSRSQLGPLSIDVIAYITARKLHSGSMDVDNVAERLRRKTRNLIPKGSQVRVLPLSAFQYLPAFSVLLLLLVVQASCTHSTRAEAERQCPVLQCARLQHPQRAAWRAPSLPAADTPAQPRCQGWTPPLGCRHRTSAVAARSVAPAHAGCWVWTGCDTLQGAAALSSMVLGPYTQHTADTVMLGCGRCHQQWLMSRSSKQTFTCLGQEVNAEVGGDAAAAVPSEDLVHVPARRAHVRAHVLHEAQQRHLRTLNFGGDQLAWAWP